MADDNTIIIDIKLDDGSVVKGLGRIKKEAKKTENAFTKNFINPINSKLKSLALSFAAFFGARALLRNIKEFGTALGEISTITKGLGIDQAALRQELINTSAQFGTNAQAQAKAFYQIISAGVTDAVKANQLLIDANKLAIGGLTSTAQAIDLLTSTVNAFQKRTISSTKAADILFATVRLGKTTIGELAGSLGQILPTADALGISFEDTNAALAALTTRGISTSEAITQLNAIFTAVLKKQKEAANLGPKVAEAFKLQALQTKGLALFLKDLNTALGGSETKLTQLLGRAEGSKAILTLAGDGFKTLTKNVEALKDSTGAADEAFKEMNKTLAQQLNITASTTSAIFLTLAKDTDGPLVGAVSNLNKQLESVLKLFADFGNIEGSIGAATTAIAIAFNELTLQLLESVNNLPAAVKGFLGITEEGLIGAGVATQIRINELEQSLLDFARGEALIEVGDKLKKPFEELPEAIIKADGFFAQFATNFKAHVENIKKDSSFLSKALGKATENIVKGTFTRLGAALAGNADAFKDFNKFIFNILGDLLIQIGVAVLGIAEAIAGINISLKSLNPGVAIAAGLFLIAAGGALKALAGGGGAATSTANAADVTGQAAIDAGAEDATADLELEKSTVVNVEIKGDVFDSAETGMRIVDIINESFDAEGTKVIAS